MGKNRTTNDEKKKTKHNFIYETTAKDEYTILFDTNKTPSIDNNNKTIRFVFSADIISFTCIRFPPAKAGGRE